MEPPLLHIQRPVEVDCSRLSDPRSCSGRVPLRGGPPGEPAVLAELLGSKGTAGGRVHLDGGQNS